MPIAVVITNPEEARPGLQWALEFCPPGESVIVFAPVAPHSKDIHEPRPLPEVAEDKSPLLTSLRQAIDAIGEIPPPEEVPIESPSGVIHTLDVNAQSEKAVASEPSCEQVLLCEVDRHEAVDEIQSAVTRHKVSLLLVPQSVAFERGHAEDDARLLFMRAPCVTVLLRPSIGELSRCQRLLVATSGGVHSREALKFAADIADRNQGQVTALYVTPPIDEVAQEVGERELARITKATVGKNPRVRQKVVVGKRILDAVAQEALEGYDVLLIGTSNHGYLRRALFGSIPQQLLKQGDGPTLAVMRRALPFTNRLRKALRYQVERWVPQLDREMRVAFVESLQGTSRLGFDFVALICLSTIIAALGLIRDSGAVVIGAMLVAPLMTPLIASGLSLVQGNWQLIRVASKTVFGGFLLSFGIGLLLGVVVPRLSPTAEMLSRGSPSAVDLLIAFVSGMAAAYAGSRPHLISALPGVAIAASLIPPVATSGMAAAIGDWPLASGALLLFLTNIVAIVLGTALSLWAVGIVGGSRDRGPRRWAVGVSLGLILLAMSMAYYELTPQLRVPAGTERAMRAAVGRYDDVDLIGLKPVWSEDPRGLLQLTLATPGPLPEALVTELQNLSTDHNVDCEIDVKMRQRIRATD